MAFWKPLPTMPPPDSLPTFRFADFELDVAAYELRQRGQPVRLERQPMDLLILLLERRRQLVSRSEIVDRLWGTGVFVDVEMGVNTAIRKVRQALQDPSDAPRFVETVPSKGYRFIADVGLVTKSPQERAALITLAVLPFENLGADPDREYLADGLTEETIASLGQIDPDRLSVIGRTSVMTYKRTNKTLAVIGRELGAAYLIESSVRAEGGRLRITPRLIRVQDQVQIWSASYDSEPSSLFAFQRELSTAIAEQIRLRLSLERLTALAGRQTRDAEAYDLYLRGRYFWNQLSPATTRRAMEYYIRATERDPEYALAWSGIADAYAGSPISADAPPLRVGPLARDAAARAVATDPNSPEAQTSMGLVKFWFDWDCAAAETAFHKAIALDPSYSMAHRLLGIVLAQMERPEEARSASRRARELDPLSAAEHALSAQVAFAARDFSAAAQFAQQAISIDPEFWVGYFQLAQAHEQLGNADLAFDALNTAGRFSGGNSKPTALRGYLFAKLGKSKEAHDVLNTLEAVLRERYIPPYSAALVHAGLGQRDAACDWLERACDARDVHLLLLPIDPKWDLFRADPRFQAILTRCAFAKRHS
jgi:TolB-like protein/Flp pilus assembly protein TadD